MRISRDISRNIIRKITIGFRQCLTMPMVALLRCLFVNATRGRLQVSLLYIVHRGDRGLIYRRDAQEEKAPVGGKYQPEGVVVAVECGGLVKEIRHNPHKEKSSHSKTIEDIQSPRYLPLKQATNHN